MDGFSYEVVVDGRIIGGIGVRHIPMTEKMNLFALDANGEYSIALLDKDQSYRLMKILGDMLEGNAGIEDGGER